MLLQSEANYLLNLIKVLKSKEINLPSPGEYLELHATDVDDTEKFIIDMNRKGIINLKKITFQTRHQRTTILLRLDIEGPPHQNPDGEIVPCPHIHIYREGYSDKWAYPLNDHIITTTSDIAQVLNDYLEYNNVKDIPPISQYLFD